MINEANATYTHSSLAAMLAGSLRAAGIAAAQELRLPNGKIADIAYFAPGETLHLVECKIDFRPVHLLEASTLYGPFCHFLWIAVPSNYPMPAVVAQPKLLFSTLYDNIGLISVSHQSAASYRVARLRSPDPLDIARTRELLAKRLTAGETAPALKTATGTECPKNSSAGHMDRRCKV